RLELVAVDELRVHQHALQRHLDAGLETGALPPLLVEAHQRADVLLRVEAAIGAPRKRRDDALGASRLVRFGRRLANADALTCGRVLSLASIERALDTHAADMRVEREPGQTARLDR